MKPDPLILETLKAPRYSIHEVLALMKIGRTRLYTMVHEGKITITKCGRRSFVTRAHLARALSGT